MFPKILKKTQDQMAALIIDFFQCIIFRAKAWVDVVENRLPEDRSACALTGDIQLSSHMS